MNTIQFEITLLKKSEYDSLYERLYKEIQFESDLTEDEIASEYEKIGKDLGQELLTNWINIDFYVECLMRNSAKSEVEIEKLIMDYSENKEDFAIADEWQDNWCHCGGIYTERICCQEYVQTVMNILSQQKNASRWSYHTSVEVEEIDFYGEFILTKDSFYAPIDKNDYNIFKKPLTRSLQGTEYSP